MHYDWSEPEMPMYSFLKYDPAMMSTHSMPCTGGDCMGYSMDYSMPCTGGDCMGYSMDYSMSCSGGDCMGYSMDYSMPCTGGDCMGSMDMHYDWYTPDYAWSEPEMPMYSTSFLKYHHALDAMWSDAYTGHNALYDDMSSGPCQGPACHGMDRYGMDTGYNTHSHALYDHMSSGPCQGPACHGMHPCQGPACDGMHSFAMDNYSAPMYSAPCQGPACHGTVKKLWRDAMYNSPVFPSMSFDSPMSAPCQGPACDGMHSFLH